MEIEVFGSMLSVTVVFSAVLLISVLWLVRAGSRSSSNIKTRVVEGAEVQGGMIDTLKELDRNDFAIFILDNDMFVQVRYIAPPGIYELDVPLNDAMSCYEYDLIEFYSRNKVDWSKCNGITVDLDCANKMIESNGDYSGLPKDSIQNVDMQFIDAYVDTPEKVAEIAESIFRDVFKREADRVEIDLSKGGNGSSS